MMLHLAWLDIYKIVFDTVEFVKRKASGLIYFIDQIKNGSELKSV